RYRRKVGEVGAVRCHDLRTQAPQFLASAQQSTGTGEDRNALVNRRGERAPHNYAHKLSKPPSVGSAAEPPSGGSNCMASWWPHNARLEARVRRGPPHSAPRDAAVAA